MNTPKEWIDKTHEITNDLEHRASTKLNTDMVQAQAEYKGYIQACEDFGRAIREQIRDTIGNEPG